MSTIQLKTPEELYNAAPDLATIAERLENSVKNTASENTRLQTQKRKNKDTPGFTSNNFKTRYPEHFRITEILREGGRWEKMPTELKFGREQFEREITTIVATRNPQAMKIVIYSGKATRNTSPPETYTIYLSENAKNESHTAIELGSVQESEKMKELESKFLELNKAGGNTSSIDLLKADFARQLNDFKHQSEIAELKRSHERELEKKDHELGRLQEDIEDLESQLSDADGELSGAADLINAKQKPPAMQMILAGAFQKMAVNLALSYPKAVTALTGLQPAEVKEMLSEEVKELEEEKTVENSGASFSEADEYDGYDAEHTERLKNIHTFAKSLNTDDFLTFYNICAYCCLPDGSINKGKSDSVLDFIKSKLE